MGATILDFHAMAGYHPPSPPREEPAMGVCTQRQVKPLDINGLHQLTKEEKAYIAGFMDGEGSIGLYEKRREGHIYGFAPRITVSNTNSDVVRWLFDLFGGSLCHVDRSQDAGKEKWRGVWQWQLEHNHTINIFLQMIQPWLRNKQEECLLMLQYCQGRTELTIEEKSVIVKQMMEIKRRRIAA
jgi:hypothetical protein